MSARSVEFVGSRYALQIYIAVAAIYIAVNMAVSAFASWLDRRQQQRYGRVAVAADPEDPLHGHEAVVLASASAQRE